MSAMSYGGMAGGGAYHPQPPQDSRPEYAGLGPSLNAAAATARDWLNCANFDASANVTHDFVLASRHFGTRNGPVAQALKISAPGGDTYFLEYREPEAWDRGQDGAYLILTQDAGGLADQHYPGVHSGTFTARMRVPAPLDSAATMNAGGVVIELVERSIPFHSVTVRAHPRAKPPAQKLNASSRVGLLSSVVVSEGEHTWAPGERLCLEGTHPFRLVEQFQEAMFELSFPGSSVPEVQWYINGHLVPQTPIGITLPNVQALITQPDLSPAEAQLQAFVQCEAETFPGGARLKTRNRPVDETYTIEVTAAFQTDIFAGSTTLSEQFVGRAFDYGTEFEQAFDACVARFMKPNIRYPKPRFVPVPDVWERLNKAQQIEAEALLAAASALVERGRAEQLKDVLRRIYEVLPRDGLQQLQHRTHFMSRSQG